MNADYHTAVVAMSARIAEMNRKHADDQARCNNMSVLMEQQARLSAQWQIELAHALKEISRLEDKVDELQAALDDAYTDLKALS